MKITGVVRSAAEITGCNYVRAFSGDGINYTCAMNELAGKRISLEAPSLHSYNYYGERDTWKAEWLKDIQEEIDWSQVKKDAEMVVWSNSRPTVKFHKHFAEYKDGKIYCWSGGCTSWSVVTTLYLTMEVWDNVELQKERP